MDNAIESQNIMWTSMLPCLSGDITQSLNTEAHSRFLDLIPSIKSDSIASDATDGHRIHVAENLLGVIEAIISGQPPSRSASLTSNLVDKLSDLWEIIASQDEERATAKKEVLEHWLPTLLRFITLHSISSEPANTATPGPTSSVKPATTTTTTANHEARARIILVLCGLMLEMETLPQELTGSLVQRTFDIATFLVDALPDDLRVQCAKSILLLPGSTANSSTTSDPRMYYLFSTPRPTSADNLKLAHRDKSSMPYTAAARGMGAMYGIGPTSNERLSPFVLRRWEILSEPTPNVGENDTSLSLGLFEAIKT
jgi:mediator of RNA polymerase II transcription subunit 12